MKTFVEDLSVDVWFRLRDSIKLNIKQGEETITDNLLLLMARQQKLNITLLRTFTDQTSKYFEDIQGTDWEWWIGSYNVGWRRFAVQAKKLNNETCRYDCLSHKVGIVKRPQVNILRDYCSGNDAEGIYCFYNYTDKITNYNNFWHCNDPKVDPVQLAWSFTPIQNVYSALIHRGKKNFQFIHSLKDSLPMRCLFSCPNFIKFFNGITPLPDSFPFKNAKLYASLPDWITHKSFTNGISNNDSNISNFLHIEDFPPRFYKKELELYPRKIAVFDLEKLYEEIAI